MAKSYRVFARSWWDGQGKPLVGRKTNIESGVTEERAREICKKFNDGQRTPAQVKRGYKYEYESY